MPTRQTRNATRWLMGALLVWGAFLAAGAVGWQLKLTDWRRGAFVLLCVLGYCCLWAVTLRHAKQPDRPLAVGRRSWSAAFAFVAAVVGCGVAAMAGWVGPESPRLAASLGAISAVALATASVGGLVAISDPVPRRGKWMAGTAWLLVVLAVVVVVWSAFGAPVATRAGG